MDKPELDQRFATLYEDHSRDVYTYVLYRVSDHHDAEDLTEQTFLQAYRHLERAIEESEGRPLRPWLIRIAHNLALNHLRDASRRPQTHIGQHDEGELEKHDQFKVQSTERTVIKREQIAAILRLVSELNDERKSALIMRYALGMDTTEIARTLGRSEGATKVLMHRTIRQLRNKAQNLEAQNSPENNLKPDVEPSVISLGKCQ